MPPRDFPVDRDDEGARLEGFLRRRLEWPRPLAMKALRKGWVRVDGRRARPDLRLAAGQVVRVTNLGLPLPGEGAPAPAGAPARAAPADAVAAARASLVLVRDDLVVADKPAGVVVHAGSGHAWGFIDALAAALGDPAPPVPVGRLDRDTSGLLVLARTRLAARRLFDGLRAGTLARTYTAAVFGRPPGREGVIDLPLERGEEGVVAGRGREARTRWRLVATRGGAALLELELDTGRTHQIRAHLAAKGLPLLGDPRYGTPESRHAAPRLFLHAGALRLEDPEGGAPRSFTAPLPAELEAAWRRLS
jgi:RluA family pseudouridine synthase